MTLPELQAAVARSLNAAINIPIVGEDQEQVFFEYLLALVWGQIPAGVRDSITSTAKFIAPEQLPAIEAKLLKVFRPILQTLLPWNKAGAHAVADKVCAQLLVLSAKGNGVSAPAAE